MIAIQSVMICFSSSVRMMNLGLPVIAICNRVNSALPHSILKEACCNLPANCWYLLSDGHFSFAIFLSNLMKSSHFLGGNWIVKSLPLNSHPRISLVNDHVPSPLRSFFSQKQGHLLDES